MADMLLRQVLLSTDPNKRVLILMSIAVRIGCSRETQ
jgi:hypothetical protein